MSDLVFNIEMDQKSVDDYVEALEEYAEIRGKKRGFERVVNHSMKDLCARAASLTKAADADKLRELYSDEKVASAVLASRIKRAGKQCKPKDEFMLGVAYMVKQAIASCNFIRSGWLPAFLAFQAVDKEGVEGSASSNFGRTDPKIPTKNAYGDIGEATLAHEEAPGVWMAEAANRSVNPRNTTSEGALERFGGAGLEQAIIFKTQDMYDYVEKVKDEDAQRGRL